MWCAHLDGCCQRSRVQWGVSWPKVNHNTAPCNGRGNGVLAPTCISASRFTDTHVLYHVTSGQCSLAGRASPSTWDFPLGSQTPSGPQTLRCWTIDLQTMWKEAKSFHMLASTFTCAQYWTILPLEFLAGEAELFHLHLPLVPVQMLNSFTFGQIHVRESRVLPVYICLWVHRHLMLNLFFTSGQYMAEKVEFFHVTSASRFTDTEVV